MKTKVFVLTVVFAFLGLTTVLAKKEKTEEFKVYGNCGMCEKRIETAAKEVNGVISADWDKETKIIVVKFDEEKTKLEAVHKAIAKAGHDTEKKKAEKKDYENLPGCCKYR